MTSSLQGFTLLAPPNMSENPDILAARLAKLDTTTTASPAGSAPSAPASPLSQRRASVFASGGGVLENGTNSGSAAGRKASISASSAAFSTERRSSAGGSGRISRRGSGVVGTPGGTPAVFHHRTNVSYYYMEIQVMLIIPFIAQDDVEFPHAEKSESQRCTVLYRDNLAHDVCRDYGRSSPQIRVSPHV